ncbi:MAG TPA: RHS repeat-associated core domain-containing protein, partial [Candidatus Angelobacter sp.]|nr:RHS repeat-associated core domain-containing protein [Candidatus Angelobacter sp.]
INYVTGATYGPDSSLTGFVSGSGGVTAITNSFSYSKRLQPVTMSATTPNQTVFSIGYDFHAGNGDNGNVYGITNYKDTTRNQTFTYDPLNRLLSAQNAGTNCAATTANGKTEYWGNNYTYDAWGNLLNKTVTKCSAENLSVTALASNQLSGYGYDAAGNMTHDLTSGLNYTFDQENRITGANGYTYTYDDGGNRVRKSNGNLAGNGTLYWYMTPGIVAETDLAGTTKSEYIFFDGERVARRDGVNGAGGVFYYISDHLKTASVITDSAGTIKSESDYYPWGGELQITANDSNHYKFTGKERDSETGLDYFGARYYSNGLGRWVSADWSATPVPVPYADFGDPQSLNLYGYVRGLPTSRVDADGHCCDWQYGVDFTTGALKGVVSSASFGWVGAPKAGDSEASLLGQTYGTFVEGLVGAGIMSKGIGDAGVGLALAPETGGASLAVSGQGLLEMGGGGLMEAGAAKNTTAIAMVAKNSQGSSSTQESTKPHGNTAGDQPAELYEKYDKNGNFQKHGVSQNSNKRYTQKQLNGGRIKVVGKGPRRQMLAKERQKVETNPGPENHEPWAGKQKKN